MIFSGFMVNAWVVATIVALVAGVVGFFVVLRGAAFAAHAIPNGAFAGAAGAVLVGVDTLIGLGVFSLLGALGIAALGRRGQRDVATALTLTLMLGTGALFLSVGNDYAAQVYSLLFGEVLGIGSNLVLPTAAMAVAAVAAVATIYRPLLLSSVLADLAAGRGIPTFAIDVCLLLVIALATTMTVPVVGTLLIFSLMVGPPAAARSFTDRPQRAIALSVTIALVAVWAAIAASYTTDYPVGFFVATISAASYAVGRGWARWRGRARLVGAPSPDAGPELAAR